ncbi:magnesium transporter [Pseudogemmatithrix spongiicola]|uniref:Magnesium transporter n=1 Tax=Pseudogemmatithrix spongiicola TaxID=3062599 RepID=A0AA49Q9E4_9BACT|nr:magnesium transporter [Gemmatimonadaceae bacterium 'strain 138']WKW16170.1 magnesium transporter [Gemmatimonadaceae bacterium 'strain 318']
MAEGRKSRKKPLTSEQLKRSIESLGPAEAADALEALDPNVAAEVLQQINPSVAGDIIPELENDKRDSLFAAAPEGVTRQWSLNLSFPEGSVGRLMEVPPLTFHPNETVGEASDRVRGVPRATFFTYAFILDAERRLVGVCTMRDLLAADDAARLEDVMLRDVFALRPEQQLDDAMRIVVHRHYPVYPVVDDVGRFLGQVRGSAMFQEQAVEISAQPGQMVGVNDEERLLTPWPRSLKFRHPWLQLNLLTAFLAAGVVGFFQETLDQMVILALFLPVLAGQSGNTGCQALAVTLRGMTLGELDKGAGKALVAKEALLGILNGFLVGLVAGAGMFFVARAQGNPNALALSGIVVLAMMGSCVISGISGALIPLTLQRVGADPATASSIFLTTATDVASMGMLLGLATMLLM